MTDKIDTARRSKNMSRIRSKDTRPELIVRRTVHGLGYRYRLHRRNLPGKPDLVFGPKKKVIFVNGCFWHQHEAVGCLDGRAPKSNTGYWNHKLQRNVERDRQNQARLRDQGWEVLVIWECETKELGPLERRLADFLGP